MANVNEGHRERLRNRMIKEGLDGFQDHEVLELLLFQFIPRKDTNKIAHDLLNTFGTFANVLNATPQQLMAVKGISQTTACNLAMLKEVWHRYKRSSAEKIRLDSLASVIMFSQQLVEESYVEKLVAVYVDSKTNFLVSEEFSSQNTHEVNINVKRIVTSAVSNNASGVILFHCHVDGACTPSQADKFFTEKLFVTLANMNIVLLEHIIFNNKAEYFSFVKERLMQQIADKYTSQTKSKQE